MTTRLSKRGLPVDTVLSRFNFLIPRSLFKWQVQKIFNNKFDHDIFSLKPKNGLLERAISINDELPFQIVSGNVVIKPGISRFHKTGVEFEDGTYEDIDCVIMGTGYLAEIPVDESVTDVSQNRIHLYRNMFPPQLEHPTLAMIGLTSQAGSSNSICEIQCRWVTLLIKGICKLPSREDMEIYIQKHKADLEEKGVFSADRGSLLVDSIPYMDEIAKDIGCYPYFWQLLLSDPKLAMKCMFGSFHPYQYRLVGPGKWGGAREAIMTAMDRVKGAYRTDQVRPKKRETSNFGIIMKTSVIAVLFTAIAHRYIF